MGKYSGCGWKAGVSEVTSNRDLWRALFAEFIGVMLLIVVACGSGIPWPDALPGYGGRVSAALCAGTTVTVLVQSTAHVSGGHLNPAVTLAMLVAKKVSCLRAIFYILTQCAGAMLGAAIIRAFCPDVLNENLGVTSLNPMIGPFQGFGVEFFITFVFILIIFAVTDDELVKAQKNGAPTICIGLSVTAAHLFALPLTGASLNPARSFGPAMVNNGWEYHWVYWVGPLTGAVAAALIYGFAFEEKVLEDKKSTKEHLLPNHSEFASVHTDNDLKSTPI